MLHILTLGLFIISALAEILGCYLFYLIVNHNKNMWLLLPASVFLTIFAYLLTLHPAAAGRIYAAYGGVYIFVAILWLWGVEGIRPSIFDIAGSGLIFTGVLIIILRF